MNRQRHNQSEPWPFLDDEERKCCKEEDSGTTPQPQGCVDEWRRKLVEARAAKDKAAAVYEKTDKSYSNSASWEARLKKWKEDAESAHKKALDAYEELELFLTAIDRTKTEDTAKAVEAVLCLVKGIFEDVNDILRVSSSAEESKGDIQALKQRIECDERLDPNKKQNALNCISPFEEQMKVISGAQAVLLTNLLEILQVVNTLVAAVDKSGTEKNSGLKWQIKDLHKRISGNAAYTARERLCGCGQEPTLPETPCDKDTVNPPKTLLPIQKLDPKSNDSVYYSHIVNLYEQAKTMTEKTKSEKADALQRKEETEAYFTGLDDAIKAAEAAESAK